MVDRAAIEPNRRVKSEVRSWKSEVGNRKSEVGSRKSEVRSGNWEVTNKQVSSLQGHLDAVIDYLIFV